ncbi:MAG: cell division topological specificity factor MinE [Bacillota bacterium]|nr:cell division topological specificity factor MinE [Bacillota bacterium]
MFDFLKFLRGNETKSKDVAKERLKLVLVHDRTNCSPEFLELIKTEIIQVIQRHLEIDEEELDIQITSTMDGESGKPTLVANIPIKELRRKNQK